MVDIHINFLPACSTEATSLQLQPGLPPSCPAQATKKRGWTPSTPSLHACFACAVLRCVQILKGNLNLVNTSFPVLMFEPRSYLQKLADIWAYPDYINAAAAQQDPLERMKLLVTWMVAGAQPAAQLGAQPAAESCT